MFEPDHSLPNWLYEALPHVYVAAGVAACLGFDPAAGRVSGTLLVTAGLLVFRMRIRYRSPAV